MGLTNKILPYYTYDDYVHWEGRWELIEGHPIAMSLLPVPKHQRVAAEMRAEFTISLRDSKCKSCKAYDPIDYKISDDTILQPDIIIVCGKIEKPFLDFQPALVVEILSPSTALRDSNTKYQFYEEQGIKYYLIVDADKKIIEVFENIDKKYRAITYLKGFEFVLDDECSITPDLENIWD